jgi:CoA-transferase family III
MQPLAGIKAVDFGTLLPAPLASLILAKAGAPVIKIEWPGDGDEPRRRRPSSSVASRKTAPGWPSRSPPSRAQARPIASVGAFAPEHGGVMVTAPAAAHSGIRTSKVRLAYQAARSAMS